MKGNPTVADLLRCCQRRWEEIRTLRRQMQELRHSLTASENSELHYKAALEQARLQTHHREAELFCLRERLRRLAEAQLERRNQ